MGRLFARRKCGRDLDDGPPVPPTSRSPRPASFSRPAPNTHTPLLSDTHPTQLWWVLLLALGIAVLIAIATLLRRCVAHHRTPAPPAFGPSGAGGGVDGAGPSYDRSESELAAVAAVQRYALHPAGRPQSEEKAGLDDRLLARLQSFSFKKPAKATDTPAGDVEAPPPPSKGKNDDEDAACVICTDPLTEGRVIALPCGHIFHKECALPWLRQESNCPNCRLELAELLGGGGRRGRRGR